MFDKLSLSFLHRSTFIELPLLYAESFPVSFIYFIQQYMQQ